MQMIGQNFIASCHLTVTNCNAYARANIPDCVVHIVCVVHTHVLHCKKYNFFEEIRIFYIKDESHIEERRVSYSFFEDDSHIQMRHISS